MNYFALIEFAEKHKDDFGVAFPPSAEPSPLPSLMAALSPWLKVQDPKLNTNGLLDDFVALLKVELTPAPPVQSTPSEYADHG